MKLWLICGNATIEAIVARPPSSLDDLLRIDGLDDEKLARWGDELLAIIRASTPRVPALDATPSPVRAVATDATP